MCLHSGCDVQVPSWGSSRYTSTLQYETPGLLLCILAGSGSQRRNNLAHRSGQGGAVLTPRRRLMYHAISHLCRLSSVDELASVSHDAQPPSTSALDAASAALDALPQLASAAQMLDATFVDVLDVHQMLLR